MGSLVHPSAVPVVAKIAGDLRRKVPDLPFVELAAQEPVCDLLAPANLSDEFDLLWPQSLEDLPYFCRLHPGLVVVQQNVIRVVGRREE